MTVFNRSMFRGGDAVQRDLHRLLGGGIGGLDPMAGAYDFLPRTTSSFDNLIPGGGVGRSLSGVQPSPVDLQLPDLPYVLKDSPLGSSSPSQPPPLGYGDRVGHPFSERAVRGAEKHDAVAELFKDMGLPLRSEEEGVPGSGVLIPTNQVGKGTSFSPDLLPGEESLLPPKGLGFTLPQSPPELKGGEEPSLNESVWSRTKGEWRDLLGPDGTLDRFPHALVEEIGGALERAGESLPYMHGAPGEPDPRKLPELSRRNEERAEKELAIQIASEEAKQVAEAAAEERNAARTELNNLKNNLGENFGISTDHLSMGTGSLTEGDESGPDTRTRKDRIRDEANFLKDLLGVSSRDAAIERALDMAYIGFAIAAGESSNALTNVAQGLLAGTGRITDRRAKERDLDQKLTLAAYQKNADEEAAAKEYAAELEVAEAKAGTAEAKSLAALDKTARTAFATNFRHTQNLKDDLDDPVYKTPLEAQIAAMRMTIPAFAGIDTPYVRSMLRTLEKYDQNEDEDEAPLLAAPTGGPTGAPTGAPTGGPTGAPPLPLRDPSNARWFEPGGALDRFPHELFGGSL